MTDQTDAVTAQTSEEQRLVQWSRQLTQALQILDFEVDQELILDLAKQAATSVSPSAGPVTALIVGYAAGLAATNGKAGAVEAVRSAAEVARKLCTDDGGAGTASGGWTDTAQ